MPAVVSRLVGFIAWHVQSPTTRAIRSAEEARKAERDRLRSEGGALHQEIGRRRSERLSGDAKRVQRAMETGT